MYSVLTMYKKSPFCTENPVFIREHMTESVICAFSNGEIHFSKLTFLFQVAFADSFALYAARVIIIVTEIIKGSGGVLCTFHCLFHNAAGLFVMKLVVFTVRIVSYHCIPFLVV